jgi:serine/threonine protein kinase
VEREGWGLGEGEQIVPGRYALKAIGGGWDYEVFLAWDEHLHSLVVAKLVRPHLVSDQHTLRSLAREADLLDRLAHPVIVRGFGAELEGDRPHLVLEHLEGPTLAQVIRRTGPLALEQLVPLAFQLASALQYLSNERVLHLDVKPGNLILGAPPRLVDLSVARTVDAASRIRAPVGTDPYMAPEQCDPALAEIGPATDVWGMGATLFEAASGRVPFGRPEAFDRTDPRQRFPQLTDRAPRRLSDAPSALDEVVSACLTPEPEQRPTAGEAGDRLEPLLERIRPRRILGRRRPRLR